MRAVGLLLLSVLRLAVALFFNVFFLLIKIALNQR